MIAFDEIMRNIFYGEEFWFILIRMGLYVLFTLILLWLLSRLKKYALRTDRIYLRYVYNIVKTVVILLGIVATLGQIPLFEKFLTTLLAGSGIAALAITLSAQETLGNLINGFMLSVFKPFEVGDRIRLINGKVTGKVEDMTLRHTVIRSSTNSRIIVPNSIVNKDMIENSYIIDTNSLNYIDVCITYDSDVELARKLMAQVIAGQPEFTDIRGEGDKHKPLVPVLVRAFAPTGIDLRADMWTTSIDVSFAACSNAREQIKQEFEKNGIRFAVSNVLPAATP